jgi:putative PIG3 family NAD(P)H quinone oxidoreductase
MPTLPSSMTVIAIRQPGGPEMLVPQQQPVPQPGEGELLVKVAAAGVNRPDVFQRMGNYPPPKGVTEIPGLELAGEVVALGPNTKRWKVGDKVTALVAGGGYAEYCVVPEPQALPIPTGFSMVEAAAMPETFFTVWHNMFERGRLSAGESVLIHGGSSGIGTTAIMLAKAFGARVFTTAGSKEKCDACTKLGADIAINYKTEDFVAATKAATGGKGADVILDMVGGIYAERNLAAVAMDGRIMHISGQAPAWSSPLRFIMEKRAVVSGSLLRPLPLERKLKIAAALKERVWPAIGTAVKPVIDSVFPLNEAAEAHRRLETSRHIGKILLQPTR